MMKKVLSVAMMAILALGMIAFTACSDNESDAGTSGSTTSDEGGSGTTDTGDNALVDGLWRYEEGDELDGPYELYRLSLSVLGTYSSADYRMRKLDSSGETVEEAYYDGTFQYTASTNSGTVSLKDLSTNESSTATFSVTDNVLTFVHKGETHELTKVEY